MTITGVLARLEERGFTIQLAIDATEPEQVTGEDEALLSALADHRDAAIEALIMRRMGDKWLPLPDDTPIPALWEYEMAQLKANENLINLLRKAGDSLTDAEKATAIEMFARAELYVTNPTAARERVTQNFKPEQLQMQ